MSGSGSSAPPAAPAEGERPEPLLVKQALAHIASRWMIERMERFRRIRPRETTLKLNVERQPEMHVEPADWRAGFLAVRDYTIVYELSNDLREVAPQALLRDLFRPESNYAREFVREEPRDVAGVEAMREARASRVRAPLPRIEFGINTVRQVLENRRRMLREQWRPITPDSQRKIKSESDARTRARLGI